jgi:hypothetical protein
VRGPELPGGSRAHARRALVGESVGMLEHCHTTDLCEHEPHIIEEGRTRWT